MPPLYGCKRGHSPILGWWVFAGFISSCSREVWWGWWTNDIDGIVLRGIRPYSGRLARLARRHGRQVAGETMWSKLARVVVNRLRSPLS